ncbi:MAG: hydroxyectoine utilization dehydratase EutB [Gammaproteobacteria bacterium]|nr:hydroxyectoine utilization dehydratase EutB [Gammaproteobacteria bacterium]
MSQKPIQPGWPAIADIRRARHRIAPAVLTTPVVSSPHLGELSGVPVFLKLEHHQTTGSFKLRGATNAVLNLSREQRARGVVGVSTGNHGRGLAHAARQAGIRCVICMSSLVPQNKIDGIERYGAEVRIVGNSQDDAQVEVDRLVQEEQMTMLPPFDHFDIIAGQGTLGLELLEQNSRFRTVLVPVSGGGLISGMAIALKAVQPEIRVVGISMERGAAMYESIQSGYPVEVEELTTLADSLGGGIGLDNRLTFSIVHELVDDLIVVSEREIGEAIHHAYWSERQILEGSGSVGIAALLSGKIKSDAPVAVLTSGGNIDMNLHHRIISGEDIDLTAA